MPGGNKTGPMGEGPMTGRGAGYCSGINFSGFSNAGPRRGVGMGAGRGGWSRRAAGGCGWRNRYFATGVAGRLRLGPNGVLASRVDLPNERETLEFKSKALQSELDAIKKRLEDLEEN